MAFHCDKCGFKNNEIQSAGEIKEQGVKIMLRADGIEDLQRQIVKSESATLKIENLDLEAPPGPGRLSNLEGFLTQIQEDLAKLQDERREQQPDVYQKVEEIIQKLQDMSAGRLFPVIVSIDDPAGNSQIQPSPHDGAGKYKTSRYNRTPQQNATLGLQTYPGNTTDASQDETAALNAAAAAAQNGAAGIDDSDIVKGKPYTFPTDCPGCGRPAAINMALMDIPHFKEVIISGVVCEHCGYRSNEVKTGGAVPEQGQRIWLDVKGMDDMKRDLLKSESCCLKIPECDLEVQPGTMGGRFTTVEGLLTQVRDDLHSSIFEDTGPGSETGDSVPGSQKAAWNNFFSKLEKAINAEMSYTIELEDPLASSYVQSYTAPEPDPQIRTEEYERTEEEEEELGLADMRTERNADGDYVKEGSTSINQ